MNVATLKIGTTLTGDNSLVDDPPPGGPTNISVAFMIRDVSNVDEMKRKVGLLLSVRYVRPHHAILGDQRVTGSNLRLGSTDDWQ